MRVVAGVDCHEGSHTAVFLDTVGQVIDRITFPTTEEGYERALRIGEQLGWCDWGLEGAGCYGYAFSVLKAPPSWRCLGVLTKRHRRHSSHSGKSDVTDVQPIAEVVLREAGRLASFHPSLLQRALRLRYDRRDRLVRERTRAVNRLRMSAVLVGVVDLPRDLTAEKAARRLGPGKPGGPAAADGDEAGEQASPPAGP